MSVHEATSAELSLELLGVFKPNRSAPLHGWVSFTEGFSAQLVARCLEGAPTGTIVYDPFGGTGTTPLVAAQLGFASSWSEVNPYLNEAAATKVLAATSGRRERRSCIAALSEAMLAGPDWEAVDSQHPLLTTNEHRDFFAERAANELVAWLARFESLGDTLARRVGRLAVASSAIASSNMKRAVDLRRRTPAEMAKPRPRVADAVRARTSAFCEDLRTAPQAQGSASMVSEDARTLPESMADVDLVVTSPPYLNGTNYFRNTKLELLLLRLIDSETELGAYRAKAVTAGINNVSKRIPEPKVIDIVEPVATQLDEVAYDVRIPKMVRAYFADMQAVLATTRAAMHASGRLVLDIGDSRFAGVHVDTPTLLQRIAESNGWSVSHVEVIRSRVAKDGNPLCQKLLSLYLT